MITTNVIHRVFQIKCGDGTGTCFTIDEEGLQYVVTATHVLEGWDGNSDLEVYYNGAWRRVRFTLVGHADNGADISVIAAPFQLSPAFPLPATNAGISYGQDVFFLGFPYGFAGDIGGMNRNFPLPLVKKAIVSAFFKSDGPEIFLLDGHNNPGFSGGPVVFKPMGSPDFQVASVISGYRAVDEPILQSGNPTDLSYQYNTGIIVSYSILSAIEMIKSNPIGFPVSK